MKPIMTILVTGIVLLSSTQVFAQAATDLTCTGCVGSTDLATSAVTGTKIQAGAVTSAKIADGTIASGDLANNAVTSAKISDGVITNDDISSTAAITASKISDGSGSGLDADSIDGVDSASLLQNGQDATIGGLTVSAGNITSASAGDICIGTCP